MNDHVKRTLCVTGLLCMMVTSGMAQETNRTAQIQEAIAWMLDGLGRKVDLQPRIDQVAAFGDAAVPSVVKTYEQADDGACWPLVACLCQIQTDAALSFVQGILRENKKRRSIEAAIRYYPIRREDDITEILIGLVGVETVGYDATERLKKMIDRKPSRAGLLVAALKDDKSEERYAYKLGEILAFASGYSHTWCVGVPPGHDPVVFRNDFWREWWNRNGNKDVFGWLVEAVTSDKDSRQAQALQRLWAIRDKRAMPYFLKALDSHSTRVQYWGVVGLKQLEGSLPKAGYLWETFDKEKDSIIPLLKQKFARMGGEQSASGITVPPEAGDSSAQ